MCGIPYCQFPRKFNFVNYWTFIIIISVPIIKMCVNWFSPWGNQMVYWSCICISTFYRHAYLRAVKGNTWIFISNFFCFYKQTWNIESVSKWILKYYAIYQRYKCWGFFFTLLYSNSNMILMLQLVLSQYGKNNIRNWIRKWRELYINLDRYLQVNVETKYSTWSSTWNKQQLCIVRVEVVRITK